MSNKIRHGLKITSLHDAQAECLCGGWTYARTGEAARADVVRHYETHLRVEAEMKQAEPWSAGIIEKEKLRTLVGTEVEVLALYGRTRRFTVGVDSAGDLIEIHNSPAWDGGTWTWCESGYATVKVIKDNGIERWFAPVTPKKEGK